PAGHLKAQVVTVPADGALEVAHPKAGMKQFRHETPSVSRRVFPQSRSPFHAAAALPPPAPPAAPRPAGEALIHAQVLFDLPRVHLAAVDVPFDPLAADEVGADVRAERFLYHLVGLERVQSLRQASRERRNSPG